MPVNAFMYYSPQVELSCFFLTDPGSLEELHHHGWRAYNNRNFLQVSIFGVHYA